MILKRLKRRDNGMKQIKEKTGKKGFSRREFIHHASLAAAGLSLAPVAPLGALSFTQRSALPNSTINGVQIGANVPYSFKGMLPFSFRGTLGPEEMDQIFDLTIETGLEAIETRGDILEQMAGAPAGEEALVTWRRSAPMQDLQDVRDKYNEAGVQISAFRYALTDDMPDWGYNYVFNAARAVGADQVAMELPRNDPHGILTDRIGRFAAEHEIMVGYHNHTQATFHFWDRAVWQSEYNGLQLDVGHYVAGTGESPIPLMQKHWDRITSLHLKDRRTDGGPNVPFGEGDTPLVEILQLMRDREASFPALIELEYSVPEESNAMREIEKCLEFCRQALT